MSKGESVSGYVTYFDFERLGRNPREKTLEGLRLHEICEAVGKGHILVAMSFHLELEIRIYGNIVRM